MGTMGRHGYLAALLRSPPVSPFTPDRATLEITDCEWKLVAFSYRLQVSGESSLGHIGPKTYLKSPITSRRPEEKYCLCRPLLYVAQKKKFPLRYLYVAQKKKISNCMQSIGCLLL